MTPSTLTLPQDAMQTTTRKRVLLARGKDKPARKPLRIPGSTA